MAALATVVVVALQIDAAIAATERQAGSAVRPALSLDADLPGNTTVFTLAAVVEIRLQIDALAAAVVQAGLT